MSLSDALNLARRSVGPAIAIAVMGYFGAHAVFGGTGVIAWQRYRDERAALEAKSTALAVEQAAVEHKVKLLDPRRVDPDYADELVRDQLQVVRPDEVIVPLDPEKPESR